MSGAWSCVCCALPRRVLEHVAQHGSGKHAARLAEHHALSQHIRATRHAPAARRASAGKERRRFVYDAARRIDPLPGELVRAEGAKAARDKAANEAYANLGITLDFYSKVFGRDSLDGRGMDVRASVHFGDRFANAMWNGRQMLFGDGDGTNIGGFTGALDIVAHELTHAVTQYEIPGGLGVVRKRGQIDLAGEAGALNESISDVFGCLVQQWHAKQKAQDADWLVGKGILRRGLGRAVRSLKAPGDTRQTYPDDDQVGDMAAYDASGDVHRNSGIPNRAFYLTAAQLRGYAWDHAGQVWYAALPALRRDSGFRDAARATLDAARRLFGDSSKEQQAVRAAWEKVGVLRR